jgi:hypothetical protein
MIRNCVRVAAFVCVLIAWLGASAHAGFTYSNFSSTSGSNLVASATQVGNEVRLSPASPSTVGSLWFATKQDVQKGFVSTFTFRITGMGGATDANGMNGGDGFAFVVQNTSNTAFGIAGSYMGYEIANSVAAEFDTWRNGNFVALEPSSNHVGVQSAGTGTNSPFASHYKGAAAVGPNMSNGALHTGRVFYQSNSMSIFVDNMVTPALTIPINLSTLLSLDSGKAFVGFTAGGAGTFENHFLSSWDFQSLAEPSSAITLLVSLMLIGRRRSI